MSSSDRHSTLERGSHSDDGKTCHGEEGAAWSFTDSRQNSLPSASARTSHGSSPVCPISARVARWSSGGTTVKFASHIEKSSSGDGCRMQMLVRTLEAEPPSYHPHLSHEVERPVPGPCRQKSTPLPPSSRSLPRPPSNESVPASPESLSAPRPAKRRFATRLPLTTSDLEVPTTSSILRRLSAPPPFASPSARSTCTAVLPSL